MTRDERKAALAVAKQEQRALDMEALDAMEIEHGDARVSAVNVPFVDGSPTMVIVRAPKGAEYKRFRDMVRRSGQDGVKIGAAADMLADVCVCYPAADVYAKMRDAVAGIHDSVFRAANQLAEGKAIEEGKD